MKAAVVHGFGRPVTIDDIPIPDPGPGEWLVKVIACGVCHTDLHAADGDWPVNPHLPFVPGHVVAGVVAALGPGVKDFKEGDPVGVAWLHDSCLRCEYCETGWEALCERQRNTGYSVNGGFAQYLFASAHFAAQLHKGTEFAHIAPILCAGVTTYKGLKETQARPGEWVAISGIGGLGHLAIQYAKAMGLHVAAIDVAPEKLALAKEVGAAIAVDARSPQAIDEVLKATGGGAHGVLVTAPSHKAFSQAFKLARRRGTVALVGMPPGDFPTPIFEVVLKRITVRGSIVGTRHDLDKAIAFAAEGKARAEIKTAPLDSINAVFSDLRGVASKVRAKGAINSGSIVIRIAKSVVGP